MIYIIKIYTVNHFHYHPLTKRAVKGLHKAADARSSITNSSITSKLVNTTLIQSTSWIYVGCNRNASIINSICLPLFDSPH